MDFSFFFFLDKMNSKREISFLIFTEFVKISLSQQTYNIDPDLERK